jgi:hypothetical protein
MSRRAGWTETLSGMGAGAVVGTAGDQATRMDESGATPAANAACKKLAWSDFADGTRTAKGAEAETGYTLPYSDADKKFSARFDATKSWATPRYKSPTCKNQYDWDLATCKKDVKDYELTTPVSDGTCPAAIWPPRTEIKTADECDKFQTVCEASAKSESARLLRHEQLHLDIPCVLADKANTALAAGGNKDTIQSALNTKSREQGTKYDDDTKNGCKAAEQATWEASVAGGLTGVTIP